MTNSPQSTCAARVETAIDHTEALIGHKTPMTALVEAVSAQMAPAKSHADSAIAHKEDVAVHKKV